MGCFSFTKWLRIMNINHSFMSTNQKFDIADYFPMSTWLILMLRSHKNNPKKLYWYKIQHGMDMSMT